MVLKLGERGFKFVFNLIVGTFSHDIIPPERLGKLCAIGQAYYRPRLILGAGQVAVSHTRSSSLRTRVKPSELLSATAREKFLREFRLCRVLSQHLTAWRAASLSRGHRDALVIRCPTLPHLE